VPMTEMKQGPFRITASGVSRLLAEGGIRTSHAERRNRHEGIYVTGRGANTTQVTVMIAVDTPSQRNHVASEAVRILEAGGYHVEASTLLHPEHGEFYASEHLIVTRVVPLARKQKEAPMETVVELEHRRFVLRTYLTGTPERPEIHTNEILDRVTNQRATSPLGVSGTVRIVAALNEHAEEFDRDLGADVEAEAAVVRQRFAKDDIEQHSPLGWKNEGH
jgi:hypothetical protein